MSYCTVTDVQNLLSAVNIKITDTSKITVTQLETEIIPEFDRYIDDRLGRYYVTPITGEKALLTMNRIEKYLVAAEVVERVYIGQTPSDSPQATTWKNFAEADLQRIIDGEIILFDAQPSGETPEQAVSMISDNLSRPGAPRPFFCGRRMEF